VVVVVTEAPVETAGFRVVSETVALEVLVVQPERQVRSTSVDLSVITMEQYRLCHTQQAP
jgi:hypothetical protein